VADGASRLEGLLDAADVRATEQALRQLGVPPPDTDEGARLVRGPTAWRDATGTVECGNSGTTVRLLIGIAAGAGVAATFDGDDSLRTRPMDRVVYPLQAMGARILYLGESDRLPVRIQGRATGSLRALKYRARVASAQVKSALLLAGLVGGVRVELLEPGRSRDHTERLLETMGAPIRREAAGRGMRIRLDPSARADGLEPLDLRVPGDPSSAAFLIAAALLASRPVRIQDVSLNPTRLGFTEVLRRMGIPLQQQVAGTSAGEPFGVLLAAPARLRPFDIGPEAIPELVDELPILCVLAARADGVSRLRGASELRLKESDRLTGIARNLQEVGVLCREMDDGLEIEGTTAPLAGRIRTRGDHRIAMAFGALSVEPTARVEIDEPEVVQVSFPSFWSELEGVRW
jgi:3-phosphoshikimate 1-carboxyvinyltransferase